MLEMAQRTDGWTGEGEVARATPAPRVLIDRSSHDDQDAA